MTQHSPAKAPCKTCPYRKDVPSGLWAEHEYRKLPEYDRPMHEQPTQMFYCHQRNGCLCSGWVASHGARNLLSMRVHVHFGRVDPESFNYESPVPVFGSGAEAAAHGMRDIEEPGDRACRAIQRLARKSKKENWK